MEAFLEVLLTILSYSLIPSYLLRFLQSKFRKLFKRGDKTLYLTFDDGPSEFTPELLDLLKKYDIKASFFAVADFAAKNPEIIERERNEGHMIGIHSVKHQNALFRDAHFVYHDIQQSLYTMRKLGCSPRYYRCPWGHLNLFTLYWSRKFDLKLVFWDVMAEDWEAEATPDRTRGRLMERVYPGAVICLHDGRGENGAPARTIAALEEAIPALLKQGYHFRRLDNE